MIVSLDYGVEDIKSLLKEYDSDTAVGYDVDLAQVVISLNKNALVNQPTYTR